MKFFAALLFSIICISMSAQIGSGNSLRFNGLSDYVRIPNDSVFWADSTYSIEFWFKADSMPIFSEVPLICKSDHWEIGITNRYMFITYDIGSTHYKRISYNALEEQEWYHVAITTNSSTIKLYMGGQLAMTHPVVSPGGRSRFDYYFGSWTGGISTFRRSFIGEMDEIRIWNTILSRTTIHKYMCRKLDTLHPNYSDLMAQYSFDDTSSTLVKDKSVNNLNGFIYGADRMNSGASIGDASVYEYPLNWVSAPNRMVIMRHPNGDSAKVSKVTGYPYGVHIYYVDTIPNNTLKPVAVDSLLTHHYYGIYVVRSWSVNFGFKTTFKYNGYPLNFDKSELNLNHRFDGSDSIWKNISVIQDTAEQSIVFTDTIDGEFIFGKNADLKDFELLELADSSYIDLSGFSTLIRTFKWRSSELQNSNVALRYNFLLDTNQYNFLNPLYSKKARILGKDTTVKIRYLSLANIMSKAGFYYGDTLNLKWSVIATVGPAKEMAIRPFNLFLIRGILSSDSIYSFYLDRPDSNLYYLSDTGSKLVSFNWERTISSAGPDVKYEVEITKIKDDFTNVLGTFASNSQGYDSLFSASENDLLTMLKNAGIPQDSTEFYKWRVKAEIGSLQRYSVDTNYIKLKWEEAYSGINRKEKNTVFNIMPNPATDRISIQSSIKIKNKWEAKLIDYQGKEVQIWKNLYGSDVSLKLIETLENGNYLLQIISENKVFTKNLIILK